MEFTQKHWAVVGGGILGMQLANRLAQQGQQVTILEAGPALGGLTAGWNAGELAWDKFYHVILLSDTALRGLLREIGLEKETRWVETKTGFYTDGELHSMSDTLEFLRFPPLSLIDKLRLGFTIFYASKARNWKRLEGIYVADWLKRLSGERAFDKIWLPLLRAKLGESYRQTSAAFIWATIQRMYAARRTGLKKEMFGYVEGGYVQILDCFARHLRAQGVRACTGFRASRVVSNDRGEVIVEDEHGNRSVFDQAILTVPSPVAARLCEGLSAEEAEKHRKIEYLGVACASLFLKKSLSPFYVTNITDQSPFTGVIEMTNIVPASRFNGHALVYLPKYAKSSDPIFRMSNEEIKTGFWKSLKAMYGKLAEEDLAGFRVARAPHVFALPTIGYSGKLPPVSTSLPGVHILNSTHIVNGTLNVNETLLLADRELPGILQAGRQQQYNNITINQSPKNQ